LIWLTLSGPRLYTRSTRKVVWLLWQPTPGARLVAGCCPGSPIDLDELSGCLLLVPAHRERQLKSCTLGRLLTVRVLLTSWTPLQSWWRRSTMGDWPCSPCWATGGGLLTPEGGEDWRPPIPLMTPRTSGERKWGHQGPTRPWYYPDSMKTDGHWQRHRMANVHLAPRRTRNQQCALEAQHTLCTHCSMTNTNGWYDLLVGIEWCVETTITMVIAQTS
jgi:hypothetical protein